MLGLTVYAHLKENVSVVSNIYSCHIMSKHNEPQNVDNFLRWFFCQERFRCIHNIKITIKNSVIKKWKRPVLTILTDISYNRKIEINKEI